MEDIKASSSDKIKNLCEEVIIKIPDDLKATFPPDECIYRVPTALRDLNAAAYTPRVISIGPVHHGDKKLKAMETQKCRYLKEFCNRLSLTAKDQQEIFLKKILGFIRDEESAIRRCYATDNSELCSDRFVKMILFDAVFIFELFLRDQDDKRYQDDFVIGKPWLRAAVRRDLILLENQLPFSILKDLYDLAPTGTPEANRISFLELTCCYFKRFNKDKSKALETLHSTETLHFTDLVRYFLSFKHPEPKSTAATGPEPKSTAATGPEPKPTAATGPIKNRYSATMLHQAGIKFKTLPEECLLDIRAWDYCPTPAPKGKAGNPVKKGELHVPPLEIDNNTECLFRNVMALEQCHYPGGEYICRYVKFLDFLIDTEKDVDLLIQNKVIVSRLGDCDTVAKLINNLCLEIVGVSSCYDDLCTLLNNYYESSWNKNKAYFVSVYFHNVWTGTGTVVGAIILAITVARFILYFFR